MGYGVCMSLIPRAALPVAPTSVTQSRPQAGARHVASPDSSPVEETSPQAGIPFGNSHVFQDEEAGSKRQDNRSRSRDLVDYSGSGQAFATIFEEVNQGIASEDVKRTRDKGFAGLVARAITVYEATSRTIHGQAEVRGASVSLTL